MVERRQNNRLGWDLSIGLFQFGVSARVEIEEPLIKDEVQ
jgi:hypothetical protein